MTDTADNPELRRLLREAFAFGLDLRHKRLCNWAAPASNFQKNKACGCGRDELWRKLQKEAFGR